MADNNLQAAIDWLKSPQRTQQVQGIGNTLEEAINNLHASRVKDEQLWNQAFQDPSQPLKVTNQEAFNEMTQRTMNGPMSFSPVGMIGTRFKGSGATSTEVPGFGPAKEIQDVDSSLNTEALQKLMDKGGSVQLSDVLSHPSLYRDYPELAKYPIQRLGNIWSAITNQLPSGLKGMYAEGSFYLPYQAKNVTTNASDIHSTLLHEVQHAIQQLDKMPEGSMAEQFFAKSASKAREKVKTLKSAAYTELTNKLKDKGYDSGTIFDIMFDNKAGKDIISKDKDIAPVASFYQKLQKSEYKLDKKYDEAYDKYKRTPGEAQARAVQKRFENPTEYSKPVTESYDIPVESLFYKDPVGFTIK